MSAAGNNPLLDAFLALLPTAAPERQASVLRRGMLQLLVDPEDQAPRPPVAPFGTSRSPAISAVDSAAWVVLKPRVRGALERLGLSCGDLSEATGIPRSTLEKTLAPSGATPGRLITGKLAAWLATRTETAAPLSCEPSAAVGAAGNGHAPASGPGAHSRAGRLSVAEREKLAGHVALTAPRELRRTLGLTAELTAEAVADAELPAEAVERIVGFLGGGGL